MKLKKRKSKLCVRILKYEQMTEEYKDRGLTWYRLVKVLNFRKNLINLLLLNK